MVDVQLNFHTNQDEVNSSIMQTEAKLKNLDKTTRGHMSAAIHNYNQAQMNEIQARSKLALGVATISAAMNIYIAVSGSTQNILFTSLMGVATASLGLYGSYIALGAAANNWALVATGVAAIGQVASVINTIRALSKMQQDKMDKQLRMQQNMKIN